MKSRLAPRAAPSVLSGRSLMLLCEETARRCQDSELTPGAVLDQLREGGPWTTRFEHEVTRAYARVLRAGGGRNG